MRRLLSLLVQHVVVGVPDERPVVGVEEHLVGNLEKEVNVSLSYQSKVWKTHDEFHVFPFILLTTDIVVFQ